MLDNKKESKEKLYINILKIVACFLVIVNHTNSEIFFSTTQNSQWIISIFTFYLSKIAVPIFILISGALVLKKEYNYKKVITKALKFSIILILISFIYYWYNCLSGETSFSIKEFIINLYNNENSPHLWYMYLYLAIIVMSPFIQKLVKNMRNVDFVFFFIVSIVMNSVFAIIPHYYPQFNLNNFYLYIFHPYIGLLLSGYYIENKLTIKKTRRAIFLCVFIIILFPIVNTVLTYLEKINNPSFYLFYDNIEIMNITIPAIAFFILIKLLCNKKSNNKIINCIAGNTMIIYFVHMLVIYNTWNIYTLLQNFFPIQISMFIWEILVFIISFTISSIFKLFLACLKKLLHFIMQQVREFKNIKNVT